VHRDVFGGLATDPGELRRRGAAMGVGSYDVYPENADTEVRTLSHRYRFFEVERAVFL